MGDADFHFLLDGVDGWKDGHLKVPYAILLGGWAGIAVSNHPLHPTPTITVCVVLVNLNLTHRYFSFLPNQNKPCEKIIINRAKAA